MTKTKSTIKALFGVFQETHQNFARPKRHIVRNNGTQIATFLDTSWYLLPKNSGPYILTRAKGLFSLQGIEVNIT